MQLGSCQHLRLLWLRSSSCCRRMLLLQLLAPPPLLQLLLPCCQPCCFRICCSIILLNTRHTQPLLLLSVTAAVCGLLRTTFLLLCSCCCWWCDAVYFLGGLLQLDFSRSLQQVLLRHQQTQVERQKQARRQAQIHAQRLLEPAFGRLLCRDNTLGHSTLCSQALQQVLQGALTPRDINHGHSTIQHSCCMKCMCIKHTCSLCDTQRTKTPHPQATTRHTPLCRLSPPHPPPHRPPLFACLPPPHPLQHPATALPPHRQTCPTCRTSSNCCATCARMASNQSAPRLRSAHTRTAYASAPLTGLPTSHTTSSLNTC